MVAIVDTAGVKVVEYLYDAWGRLLETNESLASTLGVHNPLRYRGYVYDPESGLYYLQSRYYNPELGRFINADVFISTGQGLSGNNMFVYCGNNSVIFSDTSGRLFFLALGMETNGFLSFTLQHYVGTGGGTGTGAICGSFPVDEEIADYVRGDKSVLDSEIVEDAKSLNKIKSGVTKLIESWRILMLPDPTPVNDVYAIAKATYGVVRIVWGGLQAS